MAMPVGFDRCASSEWSSAPLGLATNRRRHPHHREEETFSSAVVPAYILAGLRDRDRRGRVLPSKPLAGGLRCCGEGA